MRSIYYIATVVMIFAFQGCVKTPLKSELDISERYKPEIEDLKVFPQDISAYLSNLNPRTSTFPLQEQYNAIYFEPWNYTKPPFEKDPILWPYTSYTYEKSYGENLKPLREEWFIQMKENGNYEEYASLNKKAVSLSYLNLRNFPTDKPVFKDPSAAGEGFPFDYMQNSGVHANEPLFVSHLSKDGEWAYVFTAYATGWTKKNSIAFLSDMVTDSWQNARQIELIDEYYPIKDLEGNFIFRSRVGMRLALISIHESYYIALAITAGKNNTASYTKVKVPLNIAKEGKLLLNAENLEKITNQMLHSHYGWGGLYEEKDCSSTLRDLYAPFGVWLPRNSSQQSKMGKVIPLEELSIEAKKEAIIKQGIPFETLLYKQGHILLYLGEYNGEISVLQNIWGIKTIDDGIEGRKVIGRTIISSLEPGKEREDYNSEKGILSQLSSMNIITVEKEIEIEKPEVLK